MTIPDPASIILQAIDDRRAALMVQMQTATNTVRCAGASIALDEYNKLRNLIIHRSEAALKEQEV